MLKMCFIDNSLLACQAICAASQQRGRLCTAYRVNMPVQRLKETGYRGIALAFFDATMQEALLGLRFGV